MGNKAIFRCYPTKEPKFEASPYPRQNPPVAPKPIEHQAKAHRYEEKAADCLPEMEI
jgi:hypothetical protein